MTPQTLTANDVFGTNTQAQDILRTVITERFPNIEAQDGITAQIIDKFYDYHFPYYMGEENANIRRWSNAVKAWCFRNKKLEVVEAYYNENGTGSDFKESFTGSDTTTDTDTQTRRQVETNTGEDVTTEVDTQSRTTSERYNPINTPSSKLSGESTTTGTGGNRQTTAKAGTTRTTEYTGTGGNLTRVYKRGTTRTYSDGRTWGQVLDDVARITAPVYDFINGFGALLVSPYTPACDVWQYGTTAAAVGNVEMSPAGNPAKVTVDNVGTPLNALYKFNFEIPYAPTDFLNIETNVTPSKEQAGKLNLGQRARPWNNVYSEEYRIVKNNFAYQPVFIHSSGRYVNFGLAQNSGVRVSDTQEVNVGEYSTLGSFAFTVRKDSNILGFSVAGKIVDLRQGAYAVVTIQIESTTPAFKASLSFVIDMIEVSIYNNYPRLLNYFRKKEESCPVINGKIFVNGQFYDVESIGHRQRIAGVTDTRPVGIRYLETTADGGQIYNTLDISNCNLISSELKFFGDRTLWE